MESKRAPHRAGAVGRSLQQAGQLAERGAEQVLPARARAERSGAADDSRAVRLSRIRGVRRLDLQIDDGSGSVGDGGDRPAAADINFDGAWHEAGTEQKIAGAIACERKTFTAKVFTRASASTRLEIRTQTPDSIASFAIPYEFLLVTGAGEKVLQPGGPPTTIRAPRFIAEVGPAGERREVDAPWADTTIDCTLTVNPVQLVDALRRIRRQRQGDVESARDDQVRNGVRDRPRCHADDRGAPASERVLQHLEECERRANKLLGELNTDAPISEAPGRGSTRAWRRCRNIWTASSRRARTTCSARSYRWVSADLDTLG